MIKKILIVIAIFTVLSVFNVQNSFAVEPEAIFKDWSVFKIKQDNKDICYIASTPINREGNYRKRGEPFATIIRVKGSNYDEVNFSSGYIYGKEKNVEIAIKNKKFVLFTYEERAWASDKEADSEIIKEMKNGYKMTLQGYSTMNTYSKDTFSLLGFTDAYNKMVSLCSN